MKTLKHLFYAISCILILLLITPNIYAATDINGTGVKGSPISKCGVDSPVCWYRVTNTYDGNVIANEDGVRVSLFELNENGTIKNMHGFSDYSSYDMNGIYYLSDGNKYINKAYYSLIKYNTNVGLTPNYVNNRPSSTLPWIVRASDGANNIDEVKKWFSREPNIRMIADDLNISYDTMISTYEGGVGKYKILLEPIAYLELKTSTGYIKVAVTPTQMAMFDIRYSDSPFYSGARNMLYNNFAKAMFLQKDDLGFKAFVPPSGVQTLTNTRNYLGLAIISFGKDAVITPPSEKPVVDGTSSNATYRFDTDVFTSTTLSSNINRAKDNPISFKMVLASSGKTLCTDSIQIPENESQLAYCGWHTPKSSSKTTDKINVYADNKLVSTINISYQDIYNAVPPDPKADDPKPSYNWKTKTPDISILNNSEAKIHNDWTVWYSENNHFDGAIKGNTQTFSNLGSKVVINYYKTYERDYYDSYCSISQYTTSSTCRKNGGVWNSGYYGEWYQTGEYEVVESNTSSDYRFYRFGGYNITREPYTNSSTTTRTTGVRSTFTARDNLNAPYKDTFRVSLTGVTTNISPDPNGDPYGSEKQMSSVYRKMTTQICVITFLYFILNL